MSNFINLEACLDHVNQKSAIVIDCRFNLADPAEGFTLYQDGHIPGAFYFDLEKDLSSSVSLHGGRHPLPEMGDFIGKLQATGLTKEKKVIAYDDQDGSMAARLWWLLKYIGHEDVVILDENYKVWVERNYPVSTEIPSSNQGDITPNIKKDWIVSMETVAKQAQDDGFVVIDSRDPSRYLGEIEPLDKKAGHIPGAENWPWKDNLLEGKWLHKKDLETRFSALKKTQPITVYCGSGVTACANVIALTEAGYENVSLYPGSWSDWISYENNPIATRERK